MNILTFDIEDWFIINNVDWIPRQQWDALPQRVERNVDEILEMLAVYHAPATFFILGWVAEKYPELVKRIHDCGHELGYHCYFHTLVKNFTARSFEEDLVKGTGLIQEITGTPVRYFRAPNFSVTGGSSFIYPILARNGISVSSSVKAFEVINGVTITNKPVKINTTHGTVMEMPLNRLRLLPESKHSIAHPATGSGFFRLAPLWLLRYLFRESKNADVRPFHVRPYHMTYFHPRDFDPAPPQHPHLSAFTNWRMRVNASSTLPKLSSLLANVAFNNLGTAAAAYSKRKLTEIDL